jgi:hypothetical protein
LARYTYVGGNPFNAIDPYGLNPIYRNPVDLGAIGGAWGGGGGVGVPFGSVGASMAGRGVMATGVGSPGGRFLQITQPGPMQLFTTPTGSPAISGQLIGGGRANIRFNSDGSVRIDAHPLAGPRITEHYDDSVCPR